MITIHLHIGPLLLRPDACYVDKKITYENKRNRIVALWSRLREDIEYMSKGSTTKLSM